LLIPFDFASSRHMSEEWMPVLGYSGLYEVSDQGRARRVKTQSGRPSGRLMRPGYRRDYLNYTLSYLNVQQTFCAHRLVWEAFNGPIPEGMQINHKNGGKRDNRLTNLELCTPQENTAHAYSVLGRVRTPPPHKVGEANGRAKLKESDLPEIRRLRALGWSQQKIADQFGVNQTIISGILRGAYWRATA
jgi:hypothetical protein